MENAYAILHQVLCCTFPKGHRPDADPLFDIDSIARGLVVLGTNTRKLDLDKAIDQTHASLKAFRLLQTPIERRANKDKVAGEVRVIHMSKGIHSPVHDLVNK